MLNYILLFITKFIVLTGFMFFSIGDLSVFNIDNNLIMAFTLLFIFISFYFEDKIDSNDKKYKYVMFSCIIVTVLFNLFFYYLFMESSININFFAILLLIVIMQVLNTLEHIKGRKFLRN